MNPETRYIWSLAIKQLHAEQVNFENQEVVNRRVLARYKVLSNSKRFVSTMLQRARAQEHSGEHLATVHPEVRK